MEVVYLGWSAFKISTSERIAGTEVVIDPFNPEVVGLRWPARGGLEADIVCVTHEHPDHNFVGGIKGEPYIIRGPGEYEISGISIFGIPAFHDKKQGQERGLMTLYRLEIEDFSVAHFGNLGHKLSEEQLKELGEVDILMIPTGGKSTIDAKEAAEIAAQVEPKIVIPHHFATKRLKLEGFAPVSEFLEEMGVQGIEPVERLKLKSKNDLPEEREVVIMERV